MNSDASERDVSTQTPAQTAHARLEYYRDELLTAAAYLFVVADTADMWAEQSLSGGWSTHQVEANRGLADSCRRKAAHIYRRLGDRTERATAQGSA